MMPGVTIPCVFSKQMPLVNCTSPWENKLSGALQPFQDASHRLFVEIRTANFPGSARSDLLAFEEAGLGQPLDCAVTHAAYTARFAQAHSFGIAQRSSLARNRVIAAGRGYTVLIPPQTLSGTAHAKWGLAVPPADVGGDGRQTKPPA